MKLNNPKPGFGDFRFLRILVKIVNHGAVDEGTTRGLRPPDPPPGESLTYSPKS
jgi:hypothetical protein